MAEDTINEMIGWFFGALVLVLYPAWRIHKRAGLQPALSLLILIPYVGIVVSALVLIMSPWPNVPASKSARKR